MTEWTLSRISSRGIVYGTPGVLVVSLHQKYKNMGAQWTDQYNIKGIYVLPDM